MYSRRDFVKGLLAVGVGASLVGATGTARAQTITVTHYADTLPSAPFVIAMQQGFFEKEGFKLEGIMNATGGGTAVRNIMASDFPYGQVTLAAAIDARKAGMPLTIVNACGATIADMVMVAAPDSPMTSVKDLVGKRIGYTQPGSLTHMLTLLLLDAAGIAPSQVTLVSLGAFTNLMIALRGGKIDAVMLPEPTATVQRGKTKPIAWAKDVLPEKVMQDVGIVRSDFAKTHGKELRAVIAGRRRGVEYIYADPLRAAKILGKHYRLDQQLADEVVPRLAALHYWEEGSLDIAAMDRMAGAMRKAGLDVPIKNWGEIVDSSFVS